MKVSLNKRILNRNDECAQKNKAFFENHGVLCLNVISSPGSGKTTLLSRTILALKNKLKIGVIEGDIKTDTDAAKIRATGAAAVQIETQGACHLSAVQVHDALKQIEAAEKDVIFIENVGNLVCPSAFDLGEKKRVVLLSVPEGDDKPIKYPGTFAGADVILINKMDLIAYIPFDLDRVLTDIRKINPHARVFQVSAATGEGMQQWYDWLCDTIA
ncbi:MAG: hydrogenase nickel incorporation protein HypB [Sedimentisphaerales bacterium]|nr:hydrogenase nickel incorporation protein HypB [Sedimentisphaerales bacterium]